MGKHGFVQENKNGAEFRKNNGNISEQSATAKRYMHEREAEQSGTGKE